MIGPDLWSAVSPLLDEALDLPTEEARQAWLHNLPAHARPYRETLEQLLHDHARAQTADFLQTPAGSALRAAHAGRADPEPSGRIIGPYRLLRELGRGGMGRVWLAERTDGLVKRPVALKLPHPGLAARGFAERLARERDILAALSHPHIARLYDAGITADGQPFIALEYIEGRTIIEDCDAGRRSVRERIELFLQVLEAVQYAHAHLVIHRDLKPSNVLVDAQAQVRLLDFGVAKLLVHGHGEPTELTLDAGRALTPEYASPEQILGRTLGTASDVYSLGILLYQLLAGRRPYELARQHQASLELAILNVDVPRPSAAIAKEPEAAAARGATAPLLARTLRGDLDTIVLKALKASPEERYETAAALSADLQRYLDGEPVQARPDSRLYVLRKFVARNRLAVAAAAASVIAITVAAVGFAIEARVAIRERDYARALADRSDATARFLNDLLVEAGQSKGPVSIDDLLSQSEKLVRIGYRDNPDHRAAVLDQLAMYYATVGNHAKAADLMAQALSAASGSSDPALIDQLRCNEAMTMADLGRIDEAKARLETTLAHEFPDPRVRVVCILYRSFIAHNTNDREGSMRYAEQALAALRGQSDPLPELEAQILGTLAVAYQDNARNVDADRQFAAAMRKYVELGRDGGHVAVTVRNNWATLHGDAGQPKRALALFDEIIQITQRDDPSAQVPLYLLNNRAFMLRTIGRYEEAAAGYSAALAGARKQGNFVSTATALLGLTGLARERGEIAAAERLLAEARQVVEARLPAGATAVARMWLERGHLDLAQGRADDAFSAFDIAVKSPGPLAGRVSALGGRAQSELKLGRIEGANADARRALELAQSLQAGNAYSARTGSAWLDLSRVLLAQGDRAGASHALQSAIEHLSNTVDAGQLQLVAARAALSSLPSAQSP
ncbi:MAG TPA: protein kinase [Burkholderiaceae bacterium]|nr:protein kinase [Burkholderiaceae bacterium]